MILFFTLFTNLYVSADVNIEINHVQDQYREYEKLISSTNKILVEMNSSIENSLLSIEENKSKISSLDSQISVYEERIKSLEKDLIKTEEMKSTRVREVYKSSGYSDYIYLLLSADSFNDLLSRIDATTRLVKLDRDIIRKINFDKDEINSLSKNLEVSKSELITLNRSVKSELAVMESKKADQVSIVSNLEEEKSKFSKEVLEVAERGLISHQASIINNSSSSIVNLNNSISQLNYIKGNQIITDVVSDEISELISVANKLVLSKSSISNAVISNPDKDFGDITGDDIVTYAYQFLGLPYVWGAVGPDVFDCSGLTSYVYRTYANLEITRTTYTQINVGTPVSQSDLQPGDLVFTYNNEHVGIYVGGGNYLNATYPGSTIRVTPVTDFYAARRYL